MIHSKPGPRDPYADCARALQIALQWQRTAAATGNDRHHETARVCLEMAMEKFRTLRVHSLRYAERETLRALEADAVIAMRLEQSNRAIEDSLRLLAGVSPPIIDAEPQQARFAEGSMPAQAGMEWQSEVAE